MPTLTHLHAYNVSVERGTELDEENVLIPTWTLIFQDQVTFDQVQFAFRAPVRDFIVKGLTGGIEIAGTVPERNGDG